MDWTRHRIRISWATRLPLLPFLFCLLSGFGLEFPELYDYLLPGLWPLFFIAAGYALFRLNGFSLAVACIASTSLVALGFYLAQASPPADDHVTRHIQPQTHAEVEGILYATPTAMEDRIVFRLRLLSIKYKNKKIETSGVARITLYENEAPALLPGDRVIFKKIRLKLPRNFRNPGRFKYERYMRMQGVDVIGGTSRAETIVRSGAGDLPFYIKWRERWRQGIHHVYSEFLPDEEARLLRALTLGDRSGMDRASQEAFAATGLGHLTAVSGLHIGFVAGASLLLLRPLTFQLLWLISPTWVRAGRAPKIAAFLSIIPVAMYMLLAGDKVSVLRAGFMVLAVLVALIIDREKNAFNALLLVAIALLAHNPESLFDAGFQMSFLAVAFILYVLSLIMNLSELDAVDRMGETMSLLDRLRPRIPEDGEAPQAFIVKERVILFFVASALFSITAILATLPVVLHHFHRISISGFLLNPILTPLASLLIPFSLASALIVSALSFLGDILFAPIHWLAALFTSIPQWVAGLPGAFLYWPTPKPAWPLLYYAFLLGALSLVLRQRTSRTLNPSENSAHKIWKQLGRTLWIGAGVLTVAGFLFPRFPAATIDPLEITLLDVGQGESIFIRFPDDQTLLIDGGGFYKNSLDIGKAVVAPFLWSQGYRRLDAIAATHRDNDHISGLESILDLIPVHNLLTLDNAAWQSEARIQKLIEKAERKGTQIKSLQTGQAMTFGEARLTLLHPTSEFMDRYDSSPQNSHASNNRSLVFKLEYRKFSMLLTGDIENDAERFMLSRKAPLRSDILKAPHHGSRFSSSPEFIRATQASVVLFSSGYLNWAKHPHRETLARYEAFGTRVYRTDRDGAIRIAADGESWSVSPFEWNQD
ncbi:MAG: DNA internalization-related competence protein ComEC/Rec2 [Candidatus Nitrohelix vancouverensis]|uniref:DNA internalization-related competence protein ComEC/Rec2 n=1 Tax=Candidatus Nitrohelix vancouverensis TaxID=2705534 RepID=A0A7T0C596_9BACT|nr:MAG: DNA internalization-related competence protein ComEC/Rec2 [Candidatus Nitrohelix vancouverensis]